jgi:hypothetical protein
MLLTIASTEYLNNTRGIEVQMGEYRKLTGKGWEPYNEESRIY